MLLVFLFLVLAFGTVPASVVFEDCGSAYELLAVDIEGCTRRLPCYVTLADEVPVSIEFLAGAEAQALAKCASLSSSTLIQNHEKINIDFESRQLDQNVVININLVNLNTEVTPDQCEIEECPVRTNVMTSFTSVMTVPSRIALNQRGYLRWRVYNEDGKLVLCFSVLVQTQSPLQKLLRQALAAYTAAPEDDLDDIADNFEPNLDPNHPNITEGYLQSIINKYYANRNKQTTKDSD